MRGQLSDLFGSYLEDMVVFQMEGNLADESGCLESLDTGQERVCATFRWAFLDQSTNFMGHIF